MLLQRAPLAAAARTTALKAPVIARGLAPGLAGNELLHFALKQLRACIFAGGFFAILALSKVIAIDGLHRYDFILLAALALQAAILALRLETWDELKVLSVFHLLGLGLEIFKTHPAVGSWSYPEPGVFKVLGVPLYSGFMYAAVASYLCQAWRAFDVQLTNDGSRLLSAIAAIGIYLNFFTHHFIWDLRWPLTVLVVAVFFHTRVHLTIHARRRSFPLALAFLLLGMLIWLAENLATLGGAWVYPHQTGAWRVVGFAKIHCWSLLVIVSFVLVAHLKRVKAARGLSLRTLR